MCACSALRGVGWLLLVASCLLSGCRSWPWRPGPVPQSVATCRNLSHQALIEMEQGRWQSAEPLLQKAIDACPTDPDAQRHYAEVLAQRGATQQALVHLDQARRLAPHDASLSVRAGEIQLASGQLDKAAQHARAALATDRNAAEAWALRGRIQLARGRQPEALADLLRALGYRPDDPALLEQIGRLYLAIQRPDRALMYFQSLGQNVPPSDQGRELLALQAEAYAAVGRFADAAGYFRRATTSGPPSAELLYRLAEVEMANGDIRNARLAAEQALRLMPDHAASQQLLAQIARGPAGAAPVVQVAAPPP
ncbi:MAG: tetratricopeptide repeat protein [Planctomycetales bacterium]|nr:tetratricopeptide repeat protein [Planctomycetales bacterium]NIM09319.1 tetratricopeptide repeat protein [Planctomycetales bacterium]NIN08787.1 tetratricopeptide repeat protein [Planctomycetales bacterium]NIN77904.1 tetratricopeptide repeat protein [Planctomycetales bacterium]NIO35087.1 tetratricopeptide repeat protein [Planctomycetales bacterium]